MVLLGNSCYLRTFTEIFNNKIMIIVFTNTKGGTGKSTLATLFTQYIIWYHLGGEVTKRNHSIMLVDTDSQQNTISALHKDEEDALQDREFNWNYDFYTIHGVDEYDVKSDDIVFSEMAKIVNEYNSRIEKGIVTHLIVDLPSSLSDIVTTMINAADIIIVPFEPTDAEIHATLGFLNRLATMDKNRPDFSLDKKKIFIIPNKVQKKVQYILDIDELKEVVTKIIPAAEFTPPIVNSILFKRDTSAARISGALAELVSLCFTNIMYSSALT